ncbi:MAG: DUF6273 domain-containing protein, partial [Coriobacteriales bacterium]|nr:DUF6273 domain-containing protein [Coriobacteriales bacterium]
SGNFTGLASTSYTINLTSPQGYPTVRYFSTSDASATWSLNPGTTGATLSVTGATTRAVSIPVGATGTATLTSDAYTITFSVQANRLPSSSLKRGDTFYASGFDWRILYKASNSDVLVIAEHIIDAQAINATSTYWDTDIRWDGSALRASLNGSTYAYSYNNLTDINTKILDTTIYTRIGWEDTRTAPYKTGGASDSGHNGYQELTNQKLFLLSEEEVFRAIANGSNTTNAASMDLTQNLYGSSVVLFADNNARKTSGAATWYWLRSPRSHTPWAAYVNASTGMVNGNYVYDAYGVRPAFRMNLS